MTTKLRELLNAGDEDLFSGGACHIYAVELKDCWPELKIKHAGIQHIGVEPTPGQAVHVYAALGRYKVDVRGIISEREYLESEGYVARETSVDDLMKIDPTRSSANGPLNQVAAQPRSGVCFVRFRKGEAPHRAAASTMEIDACI